jgi:tRNA 2-thiouridine synthesizing protein E
MLDTTQFARDIEGYIVDPEAWDRDVALELAAEEHLELTEDYWQEHRVAPDVRHVVDYLIDKLGYDKKAAKKHLFDLFPYGYVKQACKVAGMQRPRAWSTG